MTGAVTPLVSSWKGHLRALSSRLSGGPQRALLAPPDASLLRINAAVPSAVAAFTPSAAEFRAPARSSTAAGPAATWRDVRSHAPPLHVLTAEQAAAGHLEGVTPRGAHFQLRNLGGCEDANLRLQQ